MEITAQHINIDKFLELFKPTFDTTINNKIVLSNEEFLKIATELKQAQLLELIVRRLSLR